MRTRIYQKITYRTTIITKSRYQAKLTLRSVFSNLTTVLAVNLVDGFNKDNRIPKIINPTKR